MMGEKSPVMQQGSESVLSAARNERERERKKIIRDFLMNIIIADSCLSKPHGPGLRSIHFPHDCLSHRKLTAWLPAHFFIKEKWDLMRVLKMEL